MPLPAVVVTALGALATYLIVQIGMLLMWFALTWFMMYSDWGLGLIHDWIGEHNWEAFRLNLPEWMPAWDEPIAAANAWAPLAEAWFFFKLYWTMFVAAIPVKWTFKLIRG